MPLVVGADGFPALLDNRGRLLHDARRDQAPDNLAFRDTSHPGGECDDLLGVCVDLDCRHASSIYLKSKLLQQTAIVK
jgi:hypothetical protein